MRLVFVFIFFSIIAFGQNKINESVDSLVLNKNSLNFGVGYGIVFVNGIILYQRLRPHKKIYSVFSSGLNYLNARSIGLGADHFLILPIRYGVLTGIENKHHFEVNAGTDLFVGIFNPPEASFLLSGNIGYRMQKPGAPLIFRMGVGFPEFLYVSLGHSF